MIGVLLAAGLLSTVGASAHSDLAKRGCMDEIYVGRDRIPEAWRREIEDALRRTGVTRRAAAMCYRGSGVWTAWVLTERRDDEAPLWVVVERDPDMKVLCMTSEDDGCRLYWIPPRRR
jgi:hypothetical protein